jgi:hypothetical protein
MGSASARAEQTVSELLIALKEQVEESPRTGRLSGPITRP